MRSRDCRACSASGLRGESRTERGRKKEVDEKGGNLQEAYKARRNQEAKMVLIK